jgi:predicted nucleic acid-binding protein
MIRVSDRILSAAGVLLPLEVRSLDAIHLESARQLGTDLGQFVTYDERMFTAAKQLGLNAKKPT